MRYLDNNDNTKSCLEKWADGKELLIATCDFWKAGTPMQRSLTGMLRSLLHQMLTQHNHSQLIQPICAGGGCTGAPRYLKTGRILRSSKLYRDLSVPQRLYYDSHYSWTVSMSLDGNDEQLQHLINFFKELARQPAVKVCVSSRPWNIFEDAYADCPNLRLQLLTEQDIKLYVQDMFEKSGRFRQIRAIDLPGCQNLVSDIVQKATGVLLWVYLVVRDLTKGLKNEHDLRTLNKRLHQIPTDLDSFFLQMLDTIEQADRTAVPRVFQIVLTRPRSISLMTLSFVEEEDVDFALHVDLSTTTLASVTDTNDSMLRRLNCLCRGLLEVKRPIMQSSGFRRVEVRWHWEVDHLHRTVEEFLPGDQTETIL